MSPVGVVSTDLSIKQFSTFLAEIPNIFRKIFPKKATL